ncbi:MAG: flavodoxin family protein [Endomicrobium sp.]|jgi:flavodoxin|nr:flavodoxin family protein [Endomicrobium sp.]
MNVLIVYSSLTGNTKLIAQSIHSELSRAEISHSFDIFPVETAPEPDNYDIIYAGFWADKGGADPKTKQYLSKIQNKSVVLFFTLGAYPHSEHANRIFINAKNILNPNNKALDEHFKCMGKIDPKILEISTKAHGAMTPERAARIEEAKKHPDENDCSNAKIFAQESFRKVCQC